MQLLPAEQKDVELCARLVRVFYAQEPGMQPLDEADATKQARLVLDAVARGQADFLLLRNGEEIAGYALLTHFFSAEYGGLVALLDEYLILPEFQGQGLGGRFLGEIKNWAGDRGYRRILLEVTEKNPRVIKLYEGNGFKLLSRRIMAFAPS